MAIHRRPETGFWWYSIYRGPDRPRLRGSTGKTDRSEAIAVEQVLRLAYLGKTPTDRLHSMIDSLSGAVRGGLPLAGIWGAYEDWAKASGRSLASMTWAHRKRACERFASWAGEHFPTVACAGDVDRSCASAFASWLSRPGAAVRGVARPAASGKTRRNLIADLGTVWEGLRRVRDDVVCNPWPLFLPADDSKRGQAFTAPQEAAILAAGDARGNGWGLACRISRFTGLRYGDVARLAWSSVDLDARVLRLTPSKTSRHCVSVVIPICDDLLCALRSARASSPGAGFVLPSHAACYPSPGRGPGCPGAFGDILAEAKVAGDYTFHSWRHTFRTRLAAAGVSDEIAKRLGGWRVDATAMRYDHDGRLEELRSAVQRGASVGAPAARTDKQP